MPTDVYIESDALWMSSHDPISHMKGMHAVRLKKESSLIELKVRLFNRTPFIQSFLWWMNVAVKVHDNYQSFFPTDVTFVVDHARRAISSFPLANNYYYGIDYHNRPGENDLTRYTNIPVPTSYMVTNSKYNFFGGYDYINQGGFVHIADRHISPGKKQWTWGNHEFGWAWDRELTDKGGPYIELMAGVYTDNQPDFSYLSPFETKTFSQYFWPYQKLGPLQNANTKAGIRMVDKGNGMIEIGVAVPEAIKDAKIVISGVIEMITTITPTKPWLSEIMIGEKNFYSLKMAVFKGEVLIISYQPENLKNVPFPQPASEPPSPEKIESLEELYLVGEHLQLYRHPTYYPESYWKEALRRDGQDLRCNSGMGKLALASGQFNRAVEFFTNAITKLTKYHGSPYTGETHYYLGLTLKYMEKHDDAYGYFYKSTWNYEFKSCGYYELATISTRRKEYERAIDHLRMADSTENNKVSVLLSILLRLIGNEDGSVAELNALLERDKLDHWALFELAKHSRDFSNFLEKSRNDSQTIIDIALDYSDCGLFEDSIEVIELYISNSVTLSRSQMTYYILAWNYDQIGNDAKAKSSLEIARSLVPDYFFPSRLEELVVLNWSLEIDKNDRNACFALGNFLYDRKRREDAIKMWEVARKADKGFPTVCRNLGIAYWNTRRDGSKALEAYEDAIRIDSSDSRVIYEYDQLRKKLGHDMCDRKSFMIENRSIVENRDDATVELATLFNSTGEPEKALELLLSHRFHPWEGGEGLCLKQYTTSRLLLGQNELKKGNKEAAIEQFLSAIKIPQCLGEAYHVNQSKSDVYYWLGKAFHSLDKFSEAKKYFEESASGGTELSELSLYQALSLQELGKKEDAIELLERLKKHGQKMMDSPAKIDYFATSLPQLLVFEEDIEVVMKEKGRRLVELAEEGISSALISNSFKQV